jgi:glucokinase
MADGDKKANKDEPSHWVGFDLGGTKMMAVVYDAAFKPLGRKRRKTRGNEGTKAGLARMVTTVEEALADAGVDAKQLAGIGVGCPGPLDLEQGILLTPPNLGWKDAKVKKTLEDKFGCRAEIANDVDAGVYGEYAMGAGRGALTVVGIFPGTGIGGGCVFRGELVRGKVMSCMEIGHMVVQPGGPLCGCGRRGCLEAVASRLAIASAAVAAAYRGEAPALLEMAGTDLANIRSKVLVESVKRGDKAVESIIREAARWIGQGTGTLVNLLAPEVVVLGGGLVEAMPELILKEVKAAAREAVMPSFRGSFEIKAAELADDATALGAAAWARHVAGS